MYKPIFYEIGLKELMRICVVGAGYVGLTTAVALAVFGHEVQYVDIDQEKINNLLKMPRFAHVTRLKAVPQSPQMRSSVSA